MGITGSDIEIASTDELSQHPNLFTNIARQRYNSFSRALPEQCSNLMVIRLQRSISEMFSPPQNSSHLHYYLSINNHRSVRSILAAEKPFMEIF